MQPHRKIKSENNSQFAPQIAAPSSSRLLRHSRGGGVPEIWGYRFAVELGALVPVEDMPDLSLVVPLGIVGIISAAVLVDLISDDATNKR